MNLKDFTYGLIILIIPLILLLIIHRFYIYNKCHNNKECIKKKLLVDIDTVNNKLVTNINFLKNDEKEEVPEEEIEGFFGGISDWLYNKVGGGTTDKNMAVPSEASLPTNTLNPPENSVKAAESNENAIPRLNSKLPTEGVIDSSNQDLLNSINNKKDTIKRYTREKIDKVGGVDKLKDINSKLQGEINTKMNNLNLQNKDQLFNNNKKDNKVQAANSIESIDNQKVNEKPQKILKNTELPNKMNMFKECNFYSDKCPGGYNDFGSIGLSGLDKNVMLSCGNVESTKPAKAVAKIKNNALEEVIVLEKGHGYNPDKPPKITVQGGKGNGAHCDAIVDDDGYLSLIKIIHPGNYYTETPNILIEAPLMNSNCHFCCKLN